MTTADIINNDFTATIFVFVIVSILSQKSDFCFVLVFGLSSFMSLVWVPFGRVGLQSYQILIGYSHKLCLHCTRISGRKNTIVNQRICGWVGVHFSPLLA